MPALPQRSASEPSASHLRRNDASTGGKAGVVLKAYGAPLTSAGSLPQLRKGAVRSAAPQRAAKAKREREEMKAAMARDRAEVASRGPSEKSVAKKLPTEGGGMKVFVSQEHNKAWKAAAKTYDLATTCPIGSKQAAIWTSYAEWCVERNKLTNATNKYNSALAAVRDPAMLEQVLAHATGAKRLPSRTASVFQYEVGCSGESTHSLRLHVHEGGEPFPRRPSISVVRRALALKR